MKRIIDLNIFRCLNPIGLTSNLRGRANYSSSSSIQGTVHKKLIQNLNNGKLGTNSSSNSGNPFNIKVFLGSKAPQGGKIKFGTSSSKVKSVVKRAEITNFSTILNTINSKQNNKDEQKQGSLKGHSKETLGKKPERKKLFQGKAINSNMISVSFLPKNWTEEDLIKYFDPTKELIDNVILLKTGNGFNSCKALLEFKSIDNCKKFLKEWEENFYDVPSCLQRLTMRMFSLEGMMVPQIPSAQIYINNIDFYTTKQDLLDIANKFGEIEAIEIPMKANKKNKGHAFVTFKEKTQAMKFVEFADNLSINKRKIK
jgi:hypothetical protein